MVGMATKANATVKLTLKQTRFISAYVGEAKGNATQAAKLAGYSGNADTLRMTGSKTVAKAYIQAAIRKIVESDPLVKNRAQRRQWWSEVIDEKENDLSHRLRASELLAKASGDFVQRVELETSEDRFREEASERFFQLMDSIRARGEKSDE